MALVMICYNSINTMSCDGAHFRQSENIVLDFLDGKIEVPEIEGFVPIVQLADWL